ncbi:TPA: hypothetical protein HA265_07045 [Candidatus Woesearchaeota archaeon]|nr:hypothetical protein [Candidatus Woesearchaeota archaeon]
MKVEFIHAKLKLGKVEFDVSMLPERVGLVTTIQYLAEMDKVKSFLESKGKKAVIAGQILGCDQEAAMRVAEEVDAFLYVGTGRFHPLGVAFKTGKKVYVLHPESMMIDEFSANVEAHRKKKQGLLARFHSSNLIGVLMTTKKGQSTVQAEKKDMFGLEAKWPDKQFYYFVCETLNLSELENFNWVECWVNTMCPRLMEDINVLNIEDLD